MDPAPGCCGRICRFLALYWRVFVLICTPLLAALLFLIETTPAYRCMYVVLIMTIFWMTSALPLPVTSMLPMVLFPPLGILDSDRTCMMYMRDVLVMFLGGIFVALAIEYCNLHKRIALKVMSAVGCSHRWLSLGLMFVTMFVSVWISNTATVAMMCPIVKAVLEELEAQGLCEVYIQDGKNENNPQPSKITICYYAATGFAANIGGCGTLLGSGTNLTFKGIYEGRFPEDQIGIDFLRFMLFNIPGVLLGTFFTWMYLQVVFLGMWRPGSPEAQASKTTKEGEKTARGFIISRYNELGPISSHEISVAILFITSVILFFTRKPGIFMGWADLLPTVKIQDSAPAILVVILLFILPSEWSCFNFCKLSPDQLPASRNQGLITWKVINDRTPWSLIFLLGGGFALAEGGKVTGMSVMIGESLAALQHLPLTLLVLLVCITCQILTEFASNIAICNITVPVLAEMSVAISLHPLYLMFPAAMSCSYAFILPVGTPPTAIVIAWGNIPLLEMFKAGIGAKITTLIVMWVLFPLWGSIIYWDISSFPEWAQPASNSSGTTELTPF